MKSLPKTESNLRSPERAAPPAHDGAEETVNLLSSLDPTVTIKGDSTSGEEPEWIGSFTERDRREVATLRAAQAAAIVAGDAGAYARLCVDDIRLMIPGHDIISGREDFLAAQVKVFRSGRFTSFKKHPERIELSGDLAVEVGRQEVQMTSDAVAAGIFSPRQKYTHVFRRTGLDWRFAILMSNPRP